VRASEIASNTRSRGAATSHSSTNRYSRDASASTAREIALCTGTDGRVAAPSSPKSRKIPAASTGPGQPQRLIGIAASRSRNSWVRPAGRSVTRIRPSPSPPASWACGVPAGVVISSPGPSRCSVPSSTSRIAPSITS
jgi:hypothetical protein